MESESTKKRGFASMPREKQREIARRGGRAAHQKGRAHEFTSDEARAAGRKGGVTVSRNRAHMARIGRAGGQARAARTPGARQRSESLSDSIREALAHVAFPVTKNDILDQAGNREISLGAGEKVRIEVVLSGTVADQFESVDDVAAEIARALEKEERHAA